MGANAGYKTMSPHRHRRLRKCTCHSDESVEILGILLSIYQETYEDLVASPANFHSQSKCPKERGAWVNVDLTGGIHVFFQRPVSQKSRNF